MVVDNGEDIGSGGGYGGVLWFLTMVRTLAVVVVVVMEVCYAYDNGEDIGSGSGGGSYGGVLWLWTMVRTLVVVLVMAVCYVYGQW